MQRQSPMNGRRGVRMFLALIAGIALGSPIALSQTFSVLYRFKGSTTDGQNPEGPLFMDKSGNLYGTTVMGPRCTPTPCSAGQGVVYEFNTAGTESLLHIFTANAGGLNPYGGVVESPSHAAYGTANGGGTSNMGVVFKLTRQGETVLHSFAGPPADGAFPYDGVVQDANGNLYGTTSAGGASNNGAIFKIGNSHEGVMYSFTGGTDGTAPYGGLLRDSAGNLFGTASAGGSTAGPCFPHGCGVVFALKAGNVFAVLHTFRGSPDGANPYAGLITDSAGNLYGTTYNGGSGPCTNGCGVVFKVSNSGVETILHNFMGYPTDGAFPYGGLAIDAQGNLYGTTTYGGSTDNGVVFRIDPSNNEKVLYSFQGTTDGALPRAGVILDSAGNIYGTAYNGGITGVSCGGSPQDSCGVIFKITP